MELFAQMPVLRTGMHQLAVIHTDLSESEFLIKDMAYSQQQRDPGAFAGREPCVYYKMSYIPPCDPFKEMRHLILRIRENTGLRAYFRGVVAIEVTQWLGHEREEYFTAMLKFLYDHRDIWHIAMVINNATPVQMQRFLAACARYVKPRYIEMMIFTDREKLTDAISAEFVRQGTRIRRDAAALLADVLGGAEWKDVRSLTLIERMAEDVIDYAGGRRDMTPKTVRGYLNDPGSVLSMMAGRVLYEERSMDLEQTALPV